MHQLLAAGRERPHSQAPRRLRTRAIALHSFACNTLFACNRKWKNKIKKDTTVLSPHRSNMKCVVNRTHDDMDIKR